MKQNIDQERKLSALFKIKQLEVPSPEFWEEFDAGLQRKMSSIGADAEPSLVEILRTWIHQYRISIASFATAACAFAMIFASQISSHFPRSLPSRVTKRCAQAVSDTFELPNNFRNATLALSLPTDTYSHYICNNMYKTGLNNSVKEVRF